MDSNKSAAGSRRSAVAERVRLRAEWAALKEADSTNDALRGIVVLVEVGSGSKALALRAALSALGATVVSTWLPLVTHVVWGAGGCRKIRAKARALACALVSPLWVEACAGAARRLPERVFPAATRPSDLPSPRQLRRMLKIAEKENIPLNLLQTSLEPTPSQRSQTRQLHVSTTSSEDSSADSDVETRVNTAPRRALPASMTPEEDGKAPEACGLAPGANGKDLVDKKSRRKLFTHKEADGEDVSSDDGRPETRPRPPIRVYKPKPVSAKVTQQERRDLARAERMARKLATAGTPARPRTTQVATQAGTSAKPIIVLTGMTGAERKALHDSIHKLNARIQIRVTKKTTHVILGSCCDPSTTNMIQTVRKDLRNIANDITGVETLDTQSILNSTVKRQVEYTGQTPGNLRVSNSKPRTLNALEGAARGCRVLTSEWVLDSAKAGRWLHPHGYEVPHLRKLSQRARVERSALCRQRGEYAFDVFCGLHIRVTEQAEQRDAAKTLLLLCGAKLVDCVAADVTVGVASGHVGSKWVFDSVASARVRSTRRYVVCDDAVEVALINVESQNSDGVFELAGKH